MAQATHMDAKLNELVNFDTLGPVDLSSLFLQRFVGFLYKAEPMWCGYST
jgi:hypothetical protein